MQDVRLGFTDSREGALAAIRRMGITCCAYSGDTWSDRCDCKYGVADEGSRWPTLGENGNGCPELRSIYGIIEALTDDEWARLVRRAGGVPRMSILAGPSIGERLHRAEAAAAMAADNIARVRAALADETGVPG